MNQNFIANRIAADALVEMVSGRIAFEFPSDVALNEYLKEHPKADRSKHWVKSNPVDKSEVEQGKPSLSKGDAEYHSSIEKGDLEGAQKVLDAHAKRAGLSERVYRGKGSAGAQNASGGIYFTNSRAVALFFADGNPDNVTEHYLHLGKTKQVVEDTSPDSIDSLSHLRDAEDEFKDSGYDSISGVHLPDGPENSNIYIIRSPNQVKSAELIMKDKQGNAIPPSQRFQ